MLNSKIDTNCPKLLTFYLNFHFLIGVVTSLNHESRMFRLYEIDPKSRWLKFIRFDHCMSTLITIALLLFLSQPYTCSIFRPTCEIFGTSLKIVKIQKINLRKRVE